MPRLHRERSRAFKIQSGTLVWIDPVNGWLVIDPASASKNEDLIRLLLKAVERFPIDTLRVGQSPFTAMSNWLLAGEAPASFTIDQEIKSHSKGEGKATIRYLRHTLDAADVRRHRESGKQCTRLALTGSDRVSFVLTEALTLKRISPLDVLKENNDGASKNDDERFDTDMALMTGELAKMIADVVKALGGEQPQIKGA